MPKQIHIFFNLLALFVISYIVVDIFYGFVGIELQRLSGPETVVLKEVAMRGETAAALPEYTRIIERNIFGATEKVEQAPAEEVIEPIEILEETSLQLSLLGTIAGDRESARAIILDNRGKSQGIYRIGDTVQEAEIKQILRGKIILRHGDKDEVLSMTEGDEKSGSAADTSGKSRAAVTARRPAPMVPAEEESAGAAEMETISIGQEELQESMSDINELMTQVRVRPYFRRGKPEGLIVSQIQPESVFAKLGLVNGDIISSVNGSEISSPEEAIQFYSNLKSGGEVSIEITRRGQKRMLTYDIQQ